MDWLWGLNASRAFSLQFGAGKPLPLGRGITAILAMVVNRQKLIDDFTSQPYYDVELKAATMPPLLAKLAQVAVGTLSLDDFIAQAKVVTQTIVDAITTLPHAAALLHAPRHDTPSFEKISRRVMANTKYLKQKCPLDRGRIVVRKNRFSAEIITSLKRIIHGKLEVAHLPWLRTF